MNAARSQRLRLPTASCRVAQPLLASVAGPTRPPVQAATTSALPAVVAGPENRPMTRLSWLRIIRRARATGHPALWRAGFSALDDPRIKELVLRLSRQSGKSQLLAAMATSELLLRPGS